MKARWNIKTGRDRNISKQKPVLVTKNKPVDKLFDDLKKPLYHDPPVTVKAETTEIDKVESDNPSDNS